MKNNEPINLPKLSNSLKYLYCDIAILQYCYITILPH